MDMSSTSDEGSDSPESTLRHPIRVIIEQEELFRCETQMINTYVRQEQKDADSHEVVKVLHAFSFCNHADIPDDALEDVIRERWKDLFGLTGSQNTSLSCEWPESINVVNEPVSGIEKVIQPSSEAEHSCSLCDISGLKQLTKYHLNKELEKVHSSKEEEKRGADSLFQSQ